MALEQRMAMQRLIADQTRQVIDRDEAGSEAQAQRRRARGGRVR
jgi:hypothetical protein